MLKRSHILETPFLVDNLLWMAREDNLPLAAALLLTTLFSVKGFKMDIRV
jgi:hypothetical protein